MSKVTKFDFFDHVLNHGNRVDIDIDGDQGISWQAIESSSNFDFEATLQVEDPDTGDTALYHVVWEKIS